MKIQQMMLILMLSIGSLQSLWAAQQKQFKLINHSDEDLAFTITINPKVLPDLSSRFKLTKNASLTSRVRNNGAQAYLSGVAKNKANLFFGVTIENGAIMIHGYKTSKIAYSWTNNGVLTICNIKRYQLKGLC